MTDAERIAEYLKTTELDEGPLEDIERMYLYRGEVLPSSRYGVTMALRDMLSDVRREEREACLADIAAERAVWHSDPTRKALDYAANRINGRGIK